MTDQTPEYDEPTDPNPADLEPQPGHDRYVPGAPTEEELAADTNLYPEPTGDEVLDGSQLPDSADLPEESTEGDPDGDV